ncbi:MAG: tetratricopeptide repeat protein [Leeuwenhoekiella sp.]
MLIYTGIKLVIGGNKIYSHCKTTNLKALHLGNSLYSLINFGIMRICRWFLYLGLISPTLYSQTVQELTEAGIAAHDAGDYGEAIANYHKALKKSPENNLLYYELAFSYSAYKEYDKSIYYADKILRTNNDQNLGAYLVKGAVLDNMGETKKSIKLFKKAIKQFPDEYLLHYNLGLDYYRLNDFKKAEKHLTLSLQHNFDHASSHLLMAYTQDAQNKPKPFSLLPLYYFLILEPDGSRADQAYTAIQKIYTRDITITSKEDGIPKTVNISINPKKRDGGSALMLALLQASQTTEENKDKPEIELFKDKTTRFFSSLTSSNFKKDELYTAYYLPFFKALSKTSYMEVYCNLISMTGIEGTSNWLNFHLREQEALYNWKEQNKP